MLPDKCTCNVFDDVIHCEAPPPNLNSANIFYTWFGVKPPNLKTANISGNTLQDLSNAYHYGGNKCALKSKCPDLQMICSVYMLHAKHLSGFMSYACKNTLHSISPCS